MARMTLPIRLQKRVSRRGSSILELLLAGCLLSVSLVPLFYLFNLTKRSGESSEKEFQAILLAQHAMERAVAVCNENAQSLPPMTGEEPVVSSPDLPQNVSEYFREVLGKTDGIQETELPVLYWALKPFKCQVDTYFLEDNLYKIIVYVFYEESGKKKRVFLERLLSRVQHKLDINALDGK